MARFTDERGWEYVVIEGERVYTERLRHRNPSSNGHKPGTEILVADDTDRPILDAWQISNYQTPDVATLPFLGRDGLIMAGGTNLLYSYPKVGKTEILTALVAEWVDLGHSVFYLTEEPYGNWKRRLGVHCCTSTKLRMVYAWGYDVHTAIRRMEEAGDFDIVVVDTLRYTVGYQEGEGDKDVTRVLVPLFKAAAGKTLMSSYHARKMPGEGGRDISGHHSLYGAFDRALQLTPVEGRENQRKVVASGRCMYDGDKSLVYEQAEPGVLRALDGAAVVEKVVLWRNCEGCGEAFRTTRVTIRDCPTCLKV